MRAARGALSTRGAAGVDNLHMQYMVLTCPTFHREMSALKSRLSMNSLLMSLILDVSHVSMRPYRASAAAWSLQYSFAACRREPSG